jgi:hypothetical protein
MACPTTIKLSTITYTPNCHVNHARLRIIQHDVKQKGITTTYWIKTQYHTSSPKTIPCKTTLNKIEFKKNGN